MNVLDIILALPLLWSIYRGFKAGIIVQAGGLVGLLAGLWLAFRFGSNVGSFFRLEEPMATVAGFVAILLLVIMGLAVAGWLARGLFRLVGLGMLDQLGGSVLSLAKMSLILGALLLGFTFLNAEKQWVDDSKLEDSKLYGPLTGTAGLIFPYAGVIKDMIMDTGGESAVHQESFREDTGTPEISMPPEPDTVSTAVNNDELWRTGQGL